MFTFLLATGALVRRQASLSLLSVFPFLLVRGALVRCQASLSPSSVFPFLLARGASVRRRPSLTRPKPSDLFQGEKILSTPSFGREVKPFVVDLRHVKDLNVTWKSGIFRQNSSAISR